MDVLVGVAITTVTLGMTLPQIPTLMEPYRLSSATRVLASQFATARMKAIAQNRRFRLAFDGDAGTYRLEEEVAPNSWQHTNGYGRQQLPSGVSFSELAANPIYDSRGMLNAPFSVVVSSSEQSKTVSVNILGHVDITG